MTTYHCHVESPIGTLLLIGEDAALTGIQMPQQRHARAMPPRCLKDAAAFATTRAQLQAYFAGERRHFELSPRPEGTSFQRRVWRALLDIPAGATVSYGELAARIGQPGAARAVGLANGKNPIALVIPCHRVVGARGHLTGYAGGLGTKRWLLAHEGVPL